jgi:hypothetical protein
MLVMRRAFGGWRLFMGSEINRAAAGFFEQQGDFQIPPFGDRLFRCDQHQMDAAGFQGHGLLGRNGQAFSQLAHLHHIALHLHLMDFRAFGRVGAEISRSPDFPVFSMLRKAPATFAFGGVARTHALLKRRSELPAACAPHAKASASSAPDKRDGFIFG